jgi:hypothetical protein
LFKSQGLVSKGKEASAAFAGLKVPAYISYNQIDHNYATAKDLASLIPLTPDSAGQDNTNGYTNPFYASLWPA